MYDQSDLPAPNGRMGLRWNVSSWRPADGGRADASDGQSGEQISASGCIIAYANNIKKCVVNWQTSAAGDLTGSCDVARSDGSKSHGA